MMNVKIKKKKFLSFTESQVCVTHSSCKFCFSLYNLDMKASDTFGPPKLKFKANCVEKLRSLEIGKKTPSNEVIFT